MSYKSVMDPERTVAKLGGTDRRHFHNPLLKLGKLARQSRSVLSDTAVARLVTLSKSLSPESAPSAWLDAFLDKWDRGGRETWNPGRNVPEAALKAMDYLDARLEPARRHLQADDGTLNFLSRDYRDGHMPEFAVALSSGPNAEEGARGWVNDYAGQKAGAATAILKLPQPDGDVRFLAVAYDPEDITTSDVFQALKFKGYQLDEQAEAQIAAFDKYADQELPEPLSKRAMDLAGKIPFDGRNAPVEGLEQLHSQPHRYDMEALEYEGPSPER